MKSFRKSAFCAIALTLIIAQGGCFSPRYFSNKTVDETNHPAWWGQLAKGDILQLKQDVLMNLHRLTLSANKITDNYDSAALFGGNVSVERYKASPDKFWPELHLLAKGTRLRCVKLMRFYTFEYSTCIVYAEILDGAFKGQVVSLGSFVSGAANVKGSLKMNTTFVEPVR